MKEKKNNRPVVAGDPKKSESSVWFGTYGGFAYAQSSNLLAATVGQNRFLMASPQGIAAFAAQGGAAILKEGGGAAFEVR